MTNKPRRPIKTALGFTVGGLLVAAGAFAMVQPESVIPEQRVVAQSLTFELPPMHERDTRALDFEQKLETRIQSGDTVASILSRLNIKEEGFMAFISANPITRKAAHRLVPGRTVQAALDPDGGMKWVRYFHTPINESKGQYLTEYLQITKQDDQSFVATEETAQTESQMHLASGRINSSLFGATDGAGVPDAVTLQMAEILGGRVDFLRDIRQGDEFRVLYETRFFEGRPAGSGRVLAVQYINDGKLVEAMWFAPDGSNGGYYDSQGKSIKAAFLRSAIPFTRVSSRFGKRMHPIHKRWRMHNGIDFAAPTGTPIRATGDGVVEFIGNKGGYGKTIILRHPNNITTLFAHQSRFAKGLKRGDRVSQGETIGYVGSTGWSTGPHLHYEFLVNNKPVDPLGIKMPEAVVLDAKQRDQFLAQAGPWRDQLERIASLNQTDTAETAATDTAVTLATR
jgi:murein DD-endopeptidase MepM/ murein hydrolase activator NlpD